MLIAKNAPAAFNNTAVGGGTLSNGTFSGPINTLPGGEYQVVAQYGGDGTFGYTTTGDGGLAPSFNITTSNGTGQQVNNGINPGTYTVNETTLPGGWNFTPPKL